MPPTTLTVTPGGPLQGHISVPGDKSISHRALLLAGIAEGQSRLVGLSSAGDCLATLGAVRALGVEVERVAPTTVVVRGRGLHGLCEPSKVLDCARSATTMRLLAGLLAGQPFFSVLSGADQLLRRPMGRVVDPLRRMGATILGRDEGNRPPLAVRGGHLQGIDYALPMASAQVKSALLLAGLYADCPTTLRLPGPARDHTERMLRAMGSAIRVVGETVAISPSESLQGLDLSIPGDFSSAAFLVVAAALLPGSELTIAGVGVNPTRTGLLDVMLAMGADVSRHGERMVGNEPIADLTVRAPVGAQGLTPVQVSGDLTVRMIDELPVFAVAATQAQGETVIRDAAELRVKEVDRITATVGELRRLGADIEPTSDGFAVRGPTPLRGSVVHSRGDHRLAMALAVAGLVATGETVIEGADCIADSFPGFLTTLRRLAGGDP